MKDKEIIIYHETVWQSIISDAFSVLSLLAAVGVGVWIDSTALQWVAGAMSVMVFITLKPKQRMTFTDIEKAKAFLDTLKYRRGWTAGVPMEERYTQENI